MKHLVLVLALSAGPAAGQEFQLAEIVDFQARASVTEDSLGAAVNPFGDNTEADEYREITVRLGERILTARTTALGGGFIWVFQNPLAFTVGRTVEARVDKRGQNLEVRVPERKNPLRFKLLRAEMIR